MEWHCIDLLFTFLPLLLFLTPFRLPIAIIVFASPLLQQFISLSCFIIDDSSLCPIFFIALSSTWRWISPSLVPISLEQQISHESEGLMFKCNLNSTSDSTNGNASPIPGEFVIGFADIHQVFPWEDIPCGGQSSDMLASLAVSLQNKLPYPLQFSSSVESCRILK